MKDINKIINTDKYSDFSFYVHCDCISNPRITVIMSVYNETKFLKSSIESVQNQTFKNFEFIIINDGSTDNSLEILMRYIKNDRRIVIINQKNMGLTKSLNRAISLARGIYIARQDADDISLPKRLEYQYNFIRFYKLYKIIGCRAIIIDEYGRKVSFFSIPPFYRALNLNLKMLKICNSFIHGTLFFEKEFIKKIGCYCDCIKYAQDYELILAALKSGCMIRILLKPMYLLRKHKNSISQSNNISQIAFTNLISYFYFNQINNHIIVKNRCVVLKKFIMEKRKSRCNNRIGVLYSLEINILNIILFMLNIIQRIIIYKNKRKI